ncbi:hypothetical protein ABK040_008113 [Willaertia magna]
MFLEIFFGFILLIISFILYIKLIEYKAIHQYVTVKDGKTPMAISIFQNIMGHVRGKEHLIIRADEHAKQNNYKPYVVMVGTRPILHVSTAEGGKQIYMNWKIFEKVEKQVTRHADEFIGKNLVFVNGDVWKRQRSILNPAFYNVERFGPVFSKKAVMTIDRMKQKSVTNGKELIIKNVGDFMTRLTLDVLGETVFGYSFNYLQNDGHNDPILNAYHTAMIGIVNIFRILGGDLAYHWPNESNRKLDESIKILNNLFAELIKKRKELVNQRVLDDSEMTLLDLMIESNLDGDRFSDTELRDNVLIFFVAGHDTTQVALSLLMYSLASTPDVQQKLYEEINKAFPDPTKSISTPEEIEKLHSLKYLECALKENLRLYPPVGVTPERYVNKTEIIDGVKVPKGSYVSAVIHAIHHNPEYWGEDVEQFKPERFLDDYEKKAPHGAWMPFGFAARTCIGNQFSLLEQKIYTVHLLQQFKIELSQDPSYYTMNNLLETKGFLLAPSPNLEVKLVPRN